MNSGGGATKRESLAPLWAVVGLMVLVGLPGIVLRVGGIHPPAAVAALTFGLAILAAAFLLGWAAETAELDMSQGLALAIIALIAVLPEYAVSFVLAWDAGSDPEVARKGLAVANMTGGNRLLIGIGWPVVFALFFYRTRLTTLVVDRQRALELVFLAVATVYGLTIPLRHTVSLIDTMVLGTLFVTYMVFTSRGESEDPVLVGPARAMGKLQNMPRRSVVSALLVFSAAVIVCSAEPFADALVHLGRQLGVSEFVLIQWLAPLASESPEVLVAGALAFRGRPAHGMGALISSKVNQWTLLIGTLPVAFLISAGKFHFTSGLPLDYRQEEELFVTAAQSAFAIAVFANLRMGGREATALFVLFATQLFITNENARIIYALLYSVLCVVVLIVNRAEIPDTLKAAWEVIRGKPEEALDRVVGAED